MRLYEWLACFLLIVIRVSFWQGVICWVSRTVELPSFFWRENPVFGPEKKCKDLYTFWNRTFLMVFISPGDFATDSTVQSGNTSMCHVAPRARVTEGVGGVEPPQLMVRPPQVICPTPPDPRNKDTQYRPRGVRWSFQPSQINPKVSTPPNTSFNPSK